MQAEDLSWMLSGDQRVDLENILSNDRGIADIYACRVSDYRAWDKAAADLVIKDKAGKPIQGFDPPHRLAWLTDTVARADAELRTYMTLQATRNKYGDFMSHERICNLIARNIMAGEPVKLPPNKGRCHV